ncbi:MAG: hypothetical protein HYS18_06460 [Burkholderiales bacterium]|nr:hypothetical protein [Burkholderiales bacterium]
MTRTIRRKYIDYDGLCQLTYVGRLLSVPGPKENIAFRAYFTPVLPPIRGETKPKRVGKAFARDMPIGDIIDIPLSTLFYEGKPIPHNDKLDEAFSVAGGHLSLNLADDNLRFVDRWHCVAPGKLLIPQGPSSLPEDPYYDGTFLCIGANDNPYEYLIPSYEVFRFFYAVSSRMAEVLLDSRFLEWSRYIWDPKRSAINRETKEARLWLRQWMLDQDAWYIASLAFDPISVERAMNLYRSIAIDQSRLLRAVPPMHEWINVQASWIHIDNGAGGHSRLVLRLKSTDWSPPFKTLKFDRDNDGRSLKTQDDQEKPTVNRPTQIVSVKPLPDNDEDPIDLTNVPSNPELSTETVPLEEVNNRFDWLPNAMIEKLPQLETEYEGERYRAKLIERWIDEMSTFQGTTSADAIRSVVLTAEDKHILASVESKGDELESPNEPAQTPNNDILEIARGLVNIRDKTDSTVEFLVLWGKPIPIESFHLFKLPAKIKDDAPRWLFKANSKRTRHALAAKITRDTELENGRIFYETRYLLDFEPKHRNASKSSIVILWTASGRELSNDDLRHIIRGFAQAKSVKVSPARMWDLHIGHRKHIVPSDEIANGIGFLNRIFETKASKS